MRRGNGVPPPNEHAVRAMQSPRPQEIRRAIHDDLWVFRDAMIAKWGIVDGKDRRKTLAHLFEHAGISIRDEMEREKRIERERGISERRAAEAAAEASIEEVAASESEDVTEKVT